MMDAAEDDQDVKLQQASADLLADFQSSLNPFLWKTRKSGKLQIRDQVRARDMERLVNLLEPFQELPQLLDPHLDKFVPVLADAFLASLQAPTLKHATTNSHLLMPISKAICKLLYTFCKIRGDKVIVRFWSTETKYLELLLTAIESNRPAEASEDEDNLSWDWEERYITLLWLSQLLLAPFDLATISSTDLDEIAWPKIQGLWWPPDTPAIAVRAITLGIQYLSSSGKERDAAKVLLVRIAMRTDMQTKEVPIRAYLMQWVVRSLQIRTDLVHSTYHYIGLLSFLAAILISSVGTQTMDPFIDQVSRVISLIITEDSAMSRFIRNFAIARKSIIKILRTIVVIRLQEPNPSSKPNSEAINPEAINPEEINTEEINSEEAKAKAIRAEEIKSKAIEFAIGHMLESLADSATPVRLAASKALSIITLKLKSDLAEQVVEEVLDGLKKNVLWQRKGDRMTRNISRVDPLEWHGLTLTLSHLVYRQSISLGDLSPVLDALRLSLSFEQRSTSGSSIGTNVRDAACFGIWAVARRYKTTDLQTLLLSSDITSKSKADASVSALQTLANDLVVSACLDPAGNIRRGSSAALQELIGRHSDTIAEGIQVVQVVDYHAVALRTRAISEVAVQASHLSEEYREAILKALSGWRGVRDTSAVSRKAAASTIGDLVWLRHLAVSPSWQSVQNAVEEIATQVRGLEPRENDERHGLILAFSAIVTLVASQLTPEILHDEVHQIHQRGASKGLDESGLYKTIADIYRYLESFLEEFKEQATRTRRQDLSAEAFSELMIATGPIPRHLSLFAKLGKVPVKTPEDASNCGQSCWIRRLIQHLLQTARALDSTTCQTALSTESDLIETYVKGASVGNFDVLSAAVRTFVLLESGLAKQTPMSARMVSHWVINCIRTRDLSYVYMLVLLFPSLKMVQDTTRFLKTWMEVFEDSRDVLDINLQENWQSATLKAILERWKADTQEVGTQATILQCLARKSTSNKLSSMLETHAVVFIKLIAEGLEDFTITARGDVGSQTRIAAAAAASAVLSRPMNHIVQKLVEEQLVGGILRIAAEKLDKVRIEGQKVLARLNQTTSSLTLLGASSQAYFSALLNLQTQDWWITCPRNTRWAIQLMEGYVTSADMGSEDLVRASRVALVDFCNNGHDRIICDQLFQILKKSKSDRFLIPALETIGFLLDMGIMQRSPPRYVTPSYVDPKKRPENNWVEFTDLVRATHYKSTNHRKLQAAIKIYGGLIDIDSTAMMKLTSMLLHTYPQIRNAAADEIWVAKGVGKGVDWHNARKADVDKLRKEIREKDAEALREVLEFSDG